MIVRVRVDANLGHGSISEQHSSKLTNHRCTDASAQAQTAINELDELVATGFGGTEIELVESMIKKLDTIESDTDDIQVAVRAMLFKLEKELPPVDVMFMYRILDWIGDLADLAQRVGSRLELMLAR